jgi:hypothetical protein
MRFWLHQNDAAPALQHWIKVSTKLAKKKVVCAVIMSLKIVMSDSGLSDIGISFFIVGLIRYRTKGLQSDIFLSDIGLGCIVVGYRRQKYLMSRPPMSIQYRSIGSENL